MNNEVVHREDSPFSTRKRERFSKEATCLDSYVNDISGGSIKDASSLNRRDWMNLFWSSMTRSKTVDMIRNELQDDEEHERDDKNTHEIENGIEINAVLPRVLGVFDLMTFGVGSTVGAGVFVITGVVAAQTSGPSMVFSFLIAAISCIFSGLCYCEFATSVPVAGSAYTYAYATMGELIGFLVGWNLTLEYGISASAVARGWAGYVNAAVESFGGHISSNLTGIDIGIAVLSPLSVVVLFACTILTAFGVKESANVNLVITCLNLAIILFIVGVGAVYVNTDNWSSFFPYGVNGMFQGASRVFFSYIGFDTVSSLAEECKDPQRTLPIGIVGTLGVSCILYMSISLIITGMVKYPNIDIDSPLSSAFSHHNVGWAASLVSLGSVTTLTATTLCSLIGQPRIFMRMAQDGLLMAPFARINRKYHTPLFGTIFTGCMASVLAFFFDIDALADMISSGTLLAFDVVCAGVLVLRYKDEESGLLPSRAMYSVIALLIGTIFIGVLFKLGVSYYVYTPMLVVIVCSATVQLTYLEQNANMSAAFVTPYVPYVPVAGILVNSGLFFQLEASAMIRLAVWTVIGIIIYLTYGIRNSVMSGSQFTVLIENN